MSKHETLIETIKQAPPATGVGLKLFGVSLADWTQIALFIWTVFLIIDKWPVVIERVRSLIAWTKEAYARIRS